MNKEDSYKNLLEKTYLEVVDFLLEKYGPAVDSYYSEVSYNRFKRGEIKAPTKRKISRTSEGLYCHHIDEDKQILISNARAIVDFNIPFEYQTKDRLVYCDLVEHAILHILIAIEDKNKIDKLNNMQLGIEGYTFYIRPQIINWLVKEERPNIQWQVNCFNKIYMDKNTSEEFVQHLDDFLISRYPITQEEIDITYQKSLIY
ncbi:hypothetical protein WKK_05395 [Weissella koreensis KACC 15510]|uniref:hypothetical protein n=1 Tax=Weissella koreensis TaxID=165096 RepID=UPI0002175057|nr:hypothetical protein [Weissella koreensis]AEJ23950.1 hypothetical protein WKK_05395 [Weissella koreensis KACC 15510]